MNSSVLLFAMADELEKISADAEKYQIEETRGRKALRAVSTATGLGVLGAGVGAASELGAHAAPKIFTIIGPTEKKIVQNAGRFGAGAAALGLGGVMLSRRKKAGLVMGEDATPEQKAKALQAIQRAGYTTSKTAAEREDPAATARIRMPSTVGRAAAVGAAAGAGLGAVYGVGRASRTWLQAQGPQSLWRDFKARRFEKKLMKRLNLPGSTEDAILHDSTEGRKLLLGRQHMADAEVAKHDIRSGVIRDHYKANIVSNTGKGAIVGAAALPAVSEGTQMYNRRQSQKR